MLALLVFSQMHAEHAEAVFSQMHAEQAEAVVTAHMLSKSSCCTDTVSGLNHSHYDMNGVHFSLLTDAAACP